MNNYVHQKYKFASIIVLITVIVLLTAEFTHSSGPESGNIGPLQKAPQWEIAEWINSPGTNIDKLKGKVVIIDFFQLWCPGCNKFTIPLINHWQKEFAQEQKTGKLVFVSIHTVFEGHNYQNPDRLKKFVRRKKIHHPVGIDRHIQGDRIPVTMRRYETRGTPEIAIIDKEGNIRFQRFGYFDPESAKQLIKKLIEENLHGSEKTSG